MHSALYEKLSRYADETRLRLHMPAHAGTLSPFDVTELAGTDDLLAPSSDSALLSDQRLAARLFSSKVTLFCAGGATLCLQTALCFFVRRLGAGAHVLCERGVHRSILHAFALLGVEPRFLDSAECASDEQLAWADLLVFSGCDYFGNVPDYAGLSARLRGADVRSLVDNAHGCHLRFVEGGRLHPLSYDFDLVVDSAHKTLPCLTGAALLHASHAFCEDEQTLREKLLSAMRLFSTSSPPFPILLSLSEAIAKLDEELCDGGSPVFAAVCARIARIRAAFAECADCRDPMRIVLRGGVDFAALFAHLRGAGVVCEFYTSRELVMLFSAAFSEKEALYLERVLSEGLALCRTEREREAFSAPAPERVMGLRQALLSESVSVPREAAVGRISAEPVGHYPPGTALCMPGERLSAQIVAELSSECVRVLAEKRDE